MKPIRVLLLSRYDRLGASSRLRSLQFIPWLEREGFDVHRQPFLSDDYLRQLYQGKKEYGHALRGLVRRMRVLHLRHHYDLVWIEKELFPWLPYAFESLWLNGAPILLDFDDAIFHNYDLSQNWLARFALRDKIDQLMRRAAAVTVGSKYLHDRATAVGAKTITFLPTVVELDRYKIRQNARTSGCVVGWIGTPKTSTYLFQVNDALQSLTRSDSIRVVLIGSGPLSLKGVPTEIHSWFEDTEADKINLLDIGIMPIPDAPWERGKCGYKLIQYMAAGIPVIASPVGANLDIIEHGVNGFLATSQDEWSHYLSLLVRDRGRRVSMGMAGRAKVESQYCTAVAAPILKKLMLQISHGVNSVPCAE
jgi:glycosyltransferase involved in cell wall biosynthesis